MRPPDDSSTLSPATLEKIRKAARRALEEASALGRLPTPVDEIMKAARIELSSEDALNEAFVARWRRKFGDGLKRAVSKVLGMLDVRGRLVYIQRAVHKAKQTFLKLHELGHGLLVWQRDIYGAIEDCEKTLDPETSDLFDREANVFATEVLFQLDSFEQQAADCAFGLRTPLKLANEYGASAYAAIRRYVSTNERPCVVIVLNPPVIRAGDGFVAAVRRAVASPAFTDQFGDVEWPDELTPDDTLGAMVPVWPKQKMSGPRRIKIRDRNGDERACVAEAFKNSYHVFLLICLESSLKRAAA